MPALANTVYPLGCGDPAVPIFPTLRSSIASAANGDTVDLSKLNCATPSLITLAQGEIKILQNNLTIYSPPGSPFTIDAAGQSRVFEHKGTGVLALNNLRLTNGLAQITSYSGAGGCVGSSGALELNNTSVTGCTGNVGGGLYALGNIKLVNSSVSGNTANGAGLAGGGIYTASSLTVKYGSSINNNRSNGAVGGAHAHGNITTKFAVISGNSDNYRSATNQLGCTALDAGGSLTMTSSSAEENYGQQASGTVCSRLVTNLSATTISDNRGYPYGSFAVFGGDISLTNSTISGNVGIGVLAAVSNPVNVFNSTITLNGGIGIYGTGSYCKFEVQSSIVANNSTNFGLGDQPGADVYLKFCANYDTSGITVDHDVIIHSNTAFPNATAIITRDPHLSPLAFRGGPVKTHALSANSPAVDAGNNLLGQANDARGAGFAREVGTAADIGAYERQPNDDEIFYGGFQ
ncbi:MAG: choice-of-anchor Q domain-containing protein [Rudaea sp.]